MELSEQQYNAQFKDTSSKKEVLSKQKEALERAWKNRDFEIELYWKRATYFWGFIAAAFAGYFIIVSTDNDFVQAEYIVICLGFIFSVAWYFANIGSKKWQENWEKHIDLLENEITGPLYKTVIDKPAYSVSRVNIRISQFVIWIWVLLGINYWFQNISFNGDFSDIDFITIAFTGLTLFFLVIMKQEKRLSMRDVGKNKKGEATFSFSLRNFEYINPKNDQE